MFQSNNYLKFTHYNYTTTDIHTTGQNGITEISSNRSGFNVKIEEIDNENIPHRHDGLREILLE